MAPKTDFAVFIGGNELVRCNRLQEPVDNHLLRVGMVIENIGTVRRGLVLQNSGIGVP